ncbi:hypothetical protein TNCV_3332601 [Trichonephila clavipes]|nr:hypothetical protein TNCV_3332601 [Trichonephila clavipes]
MEWKLIIYGTIHSDREGESEFDYVSEDATEDEYEELFILSTIENSLIFLKKSKCLMLISVQVYPSGAWDGPGG